MIRRPGRHAGRHGGAPVERAEVVVVGAGPAGPGRGRPLGEHGADVAVVDEQRAAGGQI